MTEEKPIYTEGSTVLSRKQLFMTTFLQVLGYECITSIHVIISN